MRKLTFIYDFISLIFFDKLCTDMDVFRHCSGVIKCNCSNDIPPKETAINEQNCSARKPCGDVKVSAFASNEKNIGIVKSTYYNAFEQQDSVIYHGVCTNEKSDELNTTNEYLHLQPDTTNDYFHLQTDTANVYDATFPPTVSASIDDYDVFQNIEDEYDSFHTGVKKSNLSVVETEYDKIVSIYRKNN